MSEFISMMRALPRLHAMQQRTLVDSVAMGLALVMAGKEKRSEIQRLYGTLCDRAEGNRDSSPESATSQEEMNRRFVERALKEREQKQREKERKERLLKQAKEIAPTLVVNS